MAYSFVADLSYLLPTFEFSGLSALQLLLYFGFLSVFPIHRYQAGTILHSFFSFCPALQLHTLRSSRTCSPFTITHHHPIRSHKPLKSHLFATSSIWYMFLTMENKQFSRMRGWLTSCYEHLFYRTFKFILCAYSSLPQADLVNSIFQYDLLHMCQWMHSTDLCLGTSARSSIWGWLKAVFRTISKQVCRVGLRFMSVSESR